MLLLSGYLFLRKLNCIVGSLFETVMEKITGLSDCSVIHLWLSLKIFTVQWFYFINVENQRTCAIRKINSCENTSVGNSYGTFRGGASFSYHRSSGSTKFKRFSISCAHQTMQSMGLSLIQRSTFVLRQSRDFVVKLELAS